MSLSVLHMRTGLLIIDRFKDQIEELIEFNVAEEEKGGLSHLYER